jgi:crossover junction endodeoxyribonuclease RusA
MLPCEFIVRGIPISQQAKGPSKHRWMSSVASCASVAWPNTDPPVTCNIRVRIVYYHDSAPLDTDNMLKPIIDALKGIIIVDDNQVSDITAGKRDLNGSFHVKGVSPVLANGFIGGSSFVHIYVDLAPDPTELIV